MVHVNHGIGVYRGIKKIENKGVIKDYIVIGYDKGDTLYVPCPQLDLISKYIGSAENKAIKLNRLGSPSWERAKAKVRDQSKELAKELIELYARRLNAPGFAFSPDNEWMREFEQRFEFDETDDQIRCINEIKSDMENALSVPDRSVTVKDDCYILPDKTVWQFRTQNITVESDDRWQQITAHNVTELYNGYQKQEEINKELAEVNRKLRKMYARMEDDVKEKESLDLKVYIHDTIGRSLLTIRDIIGSGEDTERKLEALQNAVGMLASNRVTSVSTMDEAKRTARQLGVAVKIYGYLARDTAAEELTVAAAKECVTNCIKHADGNEVYIRIAERNNCHDITITNNGRVPTGPIREGSGLSALRHSIESHGGEMHISHNPRFALLITIPAKEISL